MLYIFTFVNNFVWSQVSKPTLGNESDWQTVSFFNCFTLSLPPGFYAQEEFATGALSWDIKGGNFPLMVYLAKHDYPVEMPTDSNRYYIKNEIIAGKFAELAIAKPNQFAVNTGVRFKQVCGNRTLRIFTWTMVPEYKDTALIIIKTIKFK